jgi:hypothetical protein
MNDTPSPDRLEIGLPLLFPQPDPAFLDRLEDDLLHQVTSTAADAQPHAHTFRETLAAISAALRVRRWAMAALAVFLLLAALVGIVGPSRVIAAVRGLLGFIPGVGFVENTDALRTLDRPVSMNEEGVTLTVEEAVVDAASTRIRLRVEGLSGARKLVERGPDSDYQSPRLSLPDGTQIPMRGGSVDIGDTGLTVTEVYQPLPEGVFDATLEIKQIPWLPSGAAPEGWRIPLHFIPGGGDRQVLEATPVVRTSAEIDGIVLTLENVVQTPGMAILRVSFKSSDPDRVPRNWENSFSLKSSAGVVAPLSSRPDMTRRDAVTLEAPGLTPGAGYILQLNGPIQVNRIVPETETGGEFTLDLGDHPRPGDSWPLDRELTAAGQRFHLSGVSLLSGNACGFSTGEEEGTFSLVFDLPNHPGVTDVMVAPLAETPQAVSVYQNACIRYAQPPSGVLAFRIASISSPVEGTWEIPWEVPPAAAPTP